ncbi:DUF6648 family protein [Vallitalea okinawensis]|uniref:DUF6648 family protein n=1 Tax=Vallitalea okinawensis TaxID=2078660 RepID=UPI001FA8A21C|nr:DUF6648 family protein [Vallitalea okinawensis]
MHKDKFDAFFKNRKNLIFLYNKGDLSKEEFIEENFTYIMNMNVKPFRKIDHIKKGVFNYQYYNSMAKYYRMMAYDYSPHSSKRVQYLDYTNDYYSKKDYTTLKILELLDYENLDAYYVKVKSTNFKNKLIEIVLHDYPDVILHTKSSMIKKRLVDNYAFSETKQHSVIEDYINEKY